MVQRENNTIDEVGWKILTALQENSNISYKKLAEKVNLSSTAVIERIKHMEDEGIIVGYKAIVNPRKVGFTHSALLSLSTNYGNPDPIINGALEEIPEIISSWSITGLNDYIFEVNVPSLEFLEALLVKLTKHGHITTSIVLPSSIMKRDIKPPRDSLE